MPGILGSLAVGAATGASEADIKNTQTQNAQTMQENLQQQAAAVNNMYTIATEQRHITQMRQGMAYSGGLVTQAAQEHLQEQGLHMPVPNDPDQKHAANDDQIKSAMTIGSAKAGLLAPQVVAETASKEAVQEAKSESQLEAAKVIGQFNVLAQTARGKDAAVIRSHSDDIKNAGTSYTAQLNAVEKALADPLLPDSAKVPLRASYAKLIQAGAPTTNPQPETTPPGNAEPGILQPGGAPTSGAVNWNDLPK